MSWLNRSLEPNVSPGGILFSTAKEKWEAVALTYFDQHNEYQLYEMRNKVYETKQ